MFREVIYSNPSISVFSPSSYYTTGRHLRSEWFQHSDEALLPSQSRGIVYISHLLILLSQKFTINVKNVQPQYLLNQTKKIYICMMQKTYTPPCSRKNWGTPARRNKLERKMLMAVKREKLTLSNKNFFLS